MKLMTPYHPPWYLRNSLVQTIFASYVYGKIWQRQKERSPWLAKFPLIPWQEHCFSGFRDVPLWGLWSCPPGAKGTMIITYGITGDLETAWYARTLARKAYARGWAVLVYDWRSHGKSGELSPVPSSDGWHEGFDLVKLAEQLVQLGCPPHVALTGFSLGGQLSLWGLKAAREEKCPYIQTAAVLSPNLESNRSLTYLVQTPIGRIIEGILARELYQAAKLRGDRFPESTKSEAIERVDSIRAFDREMVIDYYGFATVEDYYYQTSGLYLLDKIDLPYLLVYDGEDPLFDPTLVPEIQQRTNQNPQAHLLLAPQGGHVSHLSTQTKQEDQFWGLNRLLEFCEEFRDLGKCEDKEI
ncbi:MULTISPECIES: alpha/beta fold hydrolase [Spirulina sp. CCY15215]|uniref:YheT family hydrolase n=1 Tax=Spirulina sp. CCY15215 TaxID=2767591 RepID=UPI001EF17089|nr:alpha/beta fold hydrolase [Spirulina major]